MTISYTCICTISRIKNTNSHIRIWQLTISFIWVSIFGTIKFTNPHTRICMMISLSRICIFYTIKSTNSHTRICLLCTSYNLVYMNLYILNTRIRTQNYVRWICLHEFVLLSIIKHTYSNIETHHMCNRWTTHRDT